MSQTMSSILMISTKNENVQNVYTNTSSDSFTETEIDGNMWFMVSHVHFAVDAERIYHTHEHERSQRMREKTTYTV